MRVKIVALPAGEAPEDIRKAWIGLVLPLAPEDGNGPIKEIGYGVLSRKSALGILGRLWRRITGRPNSSRQYAVPADEALAILTQTAPDAASWWRMNAPYLFGVGDRFGFASEVCEEVTYPELVSCL